MALTDILAPPADDTAIVIEARGNSGTLSDILAEAGSSDNIDVIPAAAGGGSTQKSYTFGG